MSAGNRRADVHTPVCVEVSLNSDDVGPLGSGDALEPHRGIHYARRSVGEYDVELIYCDACRATGGCGGPYTPSFGAVVCVWIDWDSPEVDRVIERTAGGRLPPEAVHDIDGRRRVAAVVDFSSPDIAIRAFNGPFAGDIEECRKALGHLLRPHTPIKYVTAMRDRGVI